MVKTQQLASKLFVSESDVRELTTELEVKQGELQELKRASSERESASSGALREMYALLPSLVDGEVSQYLLNVERASEELCASIAAARTAGALKKLGRRSCGVSSGPSLHLAKDLLLRAIAFENRRINACRDANIELQTAIQNRERDLEDVMARLDPMMHQADKLDAEMATLVELQRMKGDLEAAITRGAQDCEKARADVERASVRLRDVQGELALERERDTLHSNATRSVESPIYSKRLAAILSSLHALTHTFMGQQDIRVEVFAALRKLDSLVTSLDVVQSSRSLAWPHSAAISRGPQASLAPIEGLSSNGPMMPTRSAGTCPSAEYGSGSSPSGPNVPKGHSDILGSSGSSKPLGVSVPALPTASRGLDPPLLPTSIGGPPRSPEVSRTLGEVFTLEAQIESRIRQRQSASL